jgi:hypothetical protein
MKTMGPKTMWAALVVLMTGPCWAQDGSARGPQSPVVVQAPPSLLTGQWGSTSDGHLPHHWPVFHTPDPPGGCLWETYCPDKLYTLQRLHDLNHQYRQLRRHIGPTGKGYGVAPFDILKSECHGHFKGACNDICFDDALSDASWDRIQATECPCNSADTLDENSSAEHGVENPPMPKPPEYSAEPPVNVAPPAEPSPPRNELPNKKPRSSRRSDYLRTASGLSDFIMTYR